MDRPEPGLVKWSANSAVDSFVHINLLRRVVQVYEPTGFATRHRFDYAKLGRHDDFPQLTTYDWSPVNPEFLAVGTTSGIVNLLRIDDNSNAYLELGLKMARTCQAVAFNTTGLLAVGLDRVRMDQSLHVWDVNRLAASEAIQTRGFPPDAGGLVDTRARLLEPSVSISSLKFFEDSPQTLVAGLRGHGVRIHDLRDPTAAVTFQTKCNNNLAIDYADQNFFASSALDHPGLMIWDRRATSRPLASHVYRQAVEEDDLPWGGALRLGQVIETSSDPSFAQGKHSLIRSLRYCRDHRGLLAVLSPTGQLKVLETNRELQSSVAGPSHGPELLQVQRSHEMDVSYRTATKRNYRIVSFDWITLGSPTLRPRLLVLRANGSFAVLEQPSRTSGHAFNFVPWQTPHRGLEEDAPYQSLMRFEAPQTAEIMGTFLAEQTFDEVPIFATKRDDLEERLELAQRNTVATAPMIERINEMGAPLPLSFRKATSVAQKLRILRAYVGGHKEAAPGGAGVSYMDGETYDSETGSEGASLASNSLRTCSEVHEDLLTVLVAAEGLPSEAQSLVDHVMLVRAKEKYLFDAAANRKIVSDDPWKRFVWDWISDAENVADGGGMILGNMDLSYLGVQAIWSNDLGKNPSTRLAPGTAVPDSLQWERAVGSYCRKQRLPKYDGVSTKKPHLRQLCLEMSTWGTGKGQEAETQEGRDEAEEAAAAAAVHTMSACRALFRGDWKRAIQILRKASSAHPELLFVTLALQLTGHGRKQLAREQLEIDDAVASRTDPYLRAMSSLIATGDWATIAKQRSLPLADRIVVAFRNLDDDQLTGWLKEQVAVAVEGGDIEAIALTGISEGLVDILARYVDKFHDVQTAVLVLSIGYPRYLNDIRCRAWRNAYRALLQRHRLFLQRTKFEVESTKRSKRDGVPTLLPQGRQIALRCVYCDAETSLASQTQAPPAGGPPTSALETRNPLLATSIRAGVSCPNCGRHLPRCVVCLEVVGVPRSDKPEEREETRLAGRFPTFCLRCEHVLHLDHARLWFARHSECPVPECRCRCNFRANPELAYA